MNKNIDINEEYEKIFGVESRKTLFSADDEEYKALRQQIIDAKREFNHKKSLPFAGIKLLPYEEFKRWEIVRLAEKQGYRIFYIRNYRNSELVTYGAGYFNPNDSKFYVLKECFFEDSGYFNSLYNRMSGNKKFAFINSFRKDPGIMVENVLHKYDSASLAASCYLGERTSFRVWKDDRGKTLDAYYQRYKADDIDEKEAKTFPDYVEPTQPAEVPEQPRRYVNNITELLHQLRKDEPKKTQPSTPNAADVVASLSPFRGKKLFKKVDYPGKHLFHIIVDGRCKVWGYLDVVTTSFYICKGSLVAKDVEPKYKGDTLDHVRGRFLNDVCMDYDETFYIFKQDTMCKSASFAATYALGRIASYGEWLDDNNKFLKDIYPRHFVDVGNTQKTNTVKENPENHLFYLRQDKSPFDICNAKGWYNPDTRFFTIKVGSVISKFMDATFKGNSLEESRNLFIQNNCMFVCKKYVVQKDVTLHSPTLAAFYVMGRSADGRNVWVDSDGKTINDVYGNV